MKRIKTILIDDEPRGLSSLEKLLEVHCPKTEVVGTCTSVDSAKDMILKLQPELVFLDIAMPVKNGFELLKEINNPNFEVIFVSAHDQFLIDAFHFSAIDYLLKPIDEDLLIHAVQHAAKRINEKSSGKNIEVLIHNMQHLNKLYAMKLCLHSLKGFIVVELNDILFAESSGNYTNFCFSNRSAVCTTKTLSEYESLLSDAGFVRVHKSFIINLIHVKEYVRGEGGTVVLTDGKEVEVSRRKKDLLMSKMKEFYKY